jgi:hypothetical protein
VTIATNGSLGESTVVSELTATRIALFDLQAEVVLLRQELAQLRKEFNVTRTRLNSHEWDGH